MLILFQKRDVKSLDKLSESFIKWLKSENKEEEIYSKLVATAKDFKREARNQEGFDNGVEFTNRFMLNIMKDLAKEADIKSTTQLIDI